MIARSTHRKVAAMKTLDISANPRIPLLMDLVRSMGRFQDPTDLLRTCVGTMRRVYGARCYVQLSTRGLADGDYRISRILSPDEMELIEIPDLRDVARLPVWREGVFSQVVRGHQPLVVHELDLRGDPAVGHVLGGQHSLLAVPLLDNEFGLSWVLLLHPDPHQFSEKDLEDMILRANLVGAMVGNLDTARRLRDASAQIDREIEAIARIQHSLLPERMPEIPGVSIAASYQTFEEAGGDLYDFAQLGGLPGGWGADDERWALLVGDVSGHGPAAAVVMAMCHSILHAYPRRPAGPGEMLSHVNQHLCAKRIDQSFVTAFLGFYDASTRELVYARAGHNPPLVKQFPHCGDPVRLEAVGELPLGIMPDVRYREASITLRPRQTLILYTDGVTEARRPEGAMFGIEGIEHSLIECTGEPPCAIDHITKALKAHQVGVRPKDDQTVVAMQVA